MAATNTLPRLTADEIDDILYLTRTNDTAELLPYLSQLAQTHGTESPIPILEACVDEYSGNTAFHYAAANGSTDLLRALLNHFPPTSTTTPTSEPSSPLPSATKKTLLLNAKNAAGNTPLHWASLNGHASTVEALTAAGADVWVKNGAGNLPVFEAERAGKDEVVALLLIAGGKEVEDGLRAREGGVSREDEVEVEGDGDDDAGVGSSRAADEAAERLEKMGV